MSNPIPCESAIYAFRTAPLSEFAPQATNRYGALKVLGVNDNTIVVAVLDSVWTKPPSLNNVGSCKILRQRRFSFNGKPAIWGVSIEWWNLFDLHEVTVLGTISVTEEEMQLAAQVFDRAPGSSFSPLRFANHAVEGEWRWFNDHEAMLAEQQQIQAQQKVKAAAREEKHRTRLQGLTWEQLLAETPFERWSSDPFPSADFTRGARKTIHDTCRALFALGSRPPKAEVRKLLRECVKWFNNADQEAGGVIETEEREDICAVLEEMAYVACKESLGTDIARWRTW